MPGVFDKVSGDKIAVAYITVISKKLKAGKNKQLYLLTCQLLAI